MLKITQVRSTIGGTQKQKDTMRSLGLRRIGQTVERANDAQVWGMIRIVSHLVKVEEA